MFVILSLSPVILTLRETKGKNLALSLRTGSAKNLTRSVILNEVKDLISFFATLRTSFG
jgi:hypothetical protein